MLFDRKGTALPCAKTGSYLNGGFSNGVYKLDIAVAILKKDIRVTPLSTRGEPAKDLVIHEVPYYNRSAHKFQFLSFRFAPSQDDMLRLWPEMQRVGGGFPSTKFWPAVANLDLPGLRAGGLFWTRPFPSTEPGCYFLFAGRIHNDAAFLTRGILPALKDGVLRRSG